MKTISNIILFLSLVFFVAFTATSCRELAQNGDFSGQWQVLSIDYPDGTTVDPEGTRYYCIYRDVAQLTAPGDIRITGNLAYDEDNNRFSIQFPYEEVRYLAPWGITAPNGVAPDMVGFTADFTIQTLTSSRLVMTTGGVVITCRKF